MPATSKLMINEPLGRIDRERKPEGQNNTTNRLGKVRTSRNLSLMLKLEYVRFLH